MKAYVISEIGWQYNDSEYYQTEWSDGKPVKVFLLKEKAQEEMKAREREAVWELVSESAWHGIFAYGYEAYGPVGDTAIDWLELNGLKFDDGSYPAEGDLEKLRNFFMKDGKRDDELLDTFVSKLYASWFEVVEVELDDDTIGVKSEAA